VERVLARLALLRGSTATVTVPDAELERLARAVEGWQPRAKRARGETRQAIVSALSALDAELVNSALAALGPDERARLDREAEDELAPFRMRMLPEPYEHARRAAVARLVREQLGLPRIAFD
jgi:hypothetical protein